MQVTNTTTQALENPTIGLLAAMNIPAQESSAQRELINSTQLPSKNGSYNAPMSASDQYKKMGIKVIGLTKGDELFADVELPSGWEKRSTSHSMWNELVDDRGRVRATFFYKGAFYDRDAFISFERRFNFSIISWLSSEEKGHYEKKMVKVINENFSEDDRRNPRRTVDSERGIIYHHTFSKHYMKEIDVWVPKFKNDYIQYNNTPHYIEIKDGKKIIFSTKDNPVYFRRRYQERYHSKWWADYQKIDEQLRAQAKEWLDKEYPGWDDINAYWN